MTDDKTLDIAAIRKKLEANKGKAYWRSLDELADSEEFRSFVEREFPRQASPLTAGLSRREFVKLLGASLAFAGLTACVRPPSPPERIVPYVRQPEEIVPGRPLFFATALTVGGFAQGALIESHMGRPTKVEGNPDHPLSLGATDAQMQASVLQLYDPDRSQTVRSEGNDATWEAFTANLEQALAGLTSGSALRILTPTVTSPTLTAQIRALLTAHPGAVWHRHDPHRPEAMLAAKRQAFGTAATPRYHFDEASVIVSLGDDFLGSGPGKLLYAREFSRARRVREADDTMNRLYVLEGALTLTGAMADHRLPLKPSQLEHAARQIANALGLEVAVAEEVIPDAWLEAIVEDLQANAGNALVCAGETQNATVQALAYLINDALGNVGTTVDYLESAAYSDAEDVGSLQALVEAINAGEVETLVMIGVNPVYDAPADIDFAAALERVTTSVHLGLYFDETAARARWHVPQAHELETWGDARALDGTLTIQQPLIAPFYGGKSPLELLSAMLGAEQSAFEVIQNAYRQQAEGNFDAFWREALFRGVVGGAEVGPADVTVTLDLAAPPTAPSAGLELVLLPDPYLGGGEYSNNGWLQELPRPFTKLTWDNAALVAPATAERLELSTGSLIALRAGGQEVQAPVWVLPGQPIDTITLHLGYGREGVGRIADGVGVNAYRLQSAAAPFGGAVEVQSVAGRYRLASTQLHFALDTDGVEERHLIRAGTLAEFREDPEHPHFVHPIPHHYSDLYPDWEYTGYKWGMVIDMSACIGCNACVVACQAENNIPIVGKNEVAIGREMHWLRIDTYHRGSLDNPEFYYQPMPCHHCEKAPCEPVCPVGATVHDHEGLNVMVYNRCVGTRYCSNNCPFKVRRFNFLQYAELEENALAMVQNPNVTVRSRGVIEKCTYCTQRINAARINAENQGRRIQDGEVVTACQAACPAEAIVFGDLNDETSEVAALKASSLDYTLLEELNLYPRTSYLAKLRNPHPALTQLEGRA